MNAAARAVWPDVHQQWLLAEFARLAERLGGPPQPRPEPAPAMPPAVAQLLGVFGLSPFERDVLLLAAGVEMDAGLAALAPRVSFGLALATLEGAHWSALSPLAPLRAWRLVELDGGGPAHARLRIDERVLHHLAGVNELDTRLVPLLRAHAAPALMGQTHRAEAERLAAALAHSLSALDTVLLSGDDAEGRRDVAAEAARRCGLALCVLSQSDIPAVPAEQEALATLWQREAILLPAALLVEAGDQRPDHGAGLQRLVHRLAGLVFVAVPEGSGFEALHTARIDKPAHDGQRALWLQALGGSPDAALLEGVDNVSSQFRFSAAQIARHAEALSRGPAAAGHLKALCREHTRPQLDELAQRILPVATWQQLVLPEPQIDTLHQLAAQVHQRLRVYGEWGFAAQGERGLGISALFFGESGVGKTLACEVLAKELALDLYRIDLSSVVSKYIGETEKNLKRVFDAAEDTGAVLLFDEADALFGKRSEVKDSHDRYANIEVGYLLQRMEAYRGLAVLTTNQRSALDPAFLRRLRFVVQFPFPDEALREALWQRVFPEGMPREGLDCTRLARLPMAGGSIRNIALNAAFLAAERREPVRMSHLARAARAEATKHGRSLPAALMREWE